MPAPIDTHKVAPRALTLEAEVSAARLPPVTAAGVTLAKGVLAMVMISITLLAIYLAAVDLSQDGALSRATEAMMREADLHQAGAGGADQLRLLTELAKQIGEQRAAFRAFWLQIAQMILLNLLLPLLTALFGYIFGTTQIARQLRDEG